MWRASILSGLKDFFQLIALLLAPAIAIFLFFKLARYIQLRITWRWVKIDKTKVALRFEIENKSVIRIKKRKILIQVLEYPIAKYTTFSEWVPFEENKYEYGEEPLDWKQPTEICKSTEFLYPKEVLIVERLYTLAEMNNFLHAGIQFIAAPSLIRPFESGKALGALRWTATSFITHFSS